MKFHHDIEKELYAVFYESDWAEHPTYPLADWKYEVANNDTRLGYRDWLYNMIANEES